uniref:Bifunctional inhibitor/plant lipid transfer protein/seed storage helical domain-containing protein n=1 Tax=Cannabis sativa TaxID=3483 RepID=A0A803P1C4_CANSA
MMMKILSVVLAVMVTLLVVIAPIPMVKAMSAKQCKEERAQLVNECRPVIYGQDPSNNCCQRVRVLHVECMCPYVTPKFAKLINLARTAKQIRSCGRNIPHNFKCGSQYT